MDTTEKVEASNYDFLIYAAELYPLGLGETAPSGISLGGLSSLPEDFSNLDWIVPSYDDTNPSYNLNFKAAKTTDTPAGTFSINHKATGQFTDPSIEQFDVQNGTLTDTVTATYGTLDKVTNSDSKTRVSTFDKNGEIVNSKYTHVQNFAIISSNDTPDKSDDFTYTNSSNYLK